MNSVLAILFGIILAMILAPIYIIFAIMVGKIKRILKEGILMKFPKRRVMNEHPEWEDGFNTCRDKIIRIIKEI